MFSNLYIFLMLSLDNSTEVLKNTTAAFTKKIALVGKL